MSPPIAMAVVATAISMLFIFGIFLYFYHRFFLARYYQTRNKGSFLHEPDIKTFGGNVKGVIADENGVDVIYMMDKESRQMITSFPNCMFNPSYEDDVEKEKIIDVLVHRSKISKPHHEIPFSCESPLQKTSSMNLEKNKILMSYNDQQPPSPPPSPPPPAPPKKVIPKALLPPGPPPLPKASGFSFMKPPPAPKGKTNMREGMIGESSREKGGGGGGGQTRLKPLHWDKVMADVDHSTVWDQINDGSFR